MKLPYINQLHMPAIFTAAADLPTIGKLAVTASNLTYLNIDDEYIHRLYPLLNDKDIKKPDYFGKGLIGAHITVIYPEENKFVNNEDLNNEHCFDIKGIFSAILGSKKYYVIIINSPSLLELRRKYGLSDRLPFKNYLIDFHITIGVQLASSLGGAFFA